MINKPFGQIEKDDIDVLITNAVQENKTLEYKESLPDRTDRDKKEFLADVSAFANAAGGDILYGVEEHRDSDGKPTGLPEAANGLPSINKDAVILRLESMIRDGIAPRINGIQIRAIDGFADGPIIILRIPNSWISPHMVTFKSVSRFYSRTNAGKFPLDITEIRSAFALSETVAEKVRQFRDSRLAKVIADETPIPLATNPKVILHLVPLMALDPSSQIDLSIIDDGNYLTRLRPMGIGITGWNHRYNLDGFVTFPSYASADRTVSYVQVFRNGAIEAVCANRIREQNGRRVIPSVGLERELIESVNEYLTVLQDLGLSPPIFVIVSIFGVEGYTLSVRPNVEIYQIFPIDREMLLLPDVIAEHLPVQTVSLLRPVFDAIWQAAGFSRCMDYNDQGELVRQ